MLPNIVRFCTDCGVPAGNDFGPKLEFLCCPFLVRKIISPEEQFRIRIGFPRLFSKSEFIEFTKEKCCGAEILNGARHLNCGWEFNKMNKNKYEGKKSSCRGSNPDLFAFGPNGYFQIFWTPTKTGAKQQLVQHANYHSWNHQSGDSNPQNCVGKPISSCIIY